MLKINFLSNEGIQKNIGSRQDDAPKTKQSIQDNLKKYNDIENPAKKIDPSIFSNVENELEQELSKQSKQIKKPKKTNKPQTNIHSKKKNYLILWFIIICIVIIGCFYLSTKVDLSNLDILSKLNSLLDKKSQHTETTQVENNDLQTNEISDVYIKKILVNKVKLDIGVTLLNFIPNNSDIITFEINDSTISMIFKTKSQEEGQNFKKRIENLSNILTPKFVYIDKTLDNGDDYQVTTLLNITSKFPNNDFGYRYYEDKILANLISKLAIKTNVQVEPLRISKRDPLLLRNSFITGIGSKSNITYFFKDLYTTKMNFNVNTIKIEQADNKNLEKNLIFYLNAIIYPQDS